MKQRQFFGDIPPEVQEAIEKRIQFGVEQGHLDKDGGIPDGKLRPQTAKMMEIVGNPAGARGIWCRAFITAYVKEGIKNGKYDESGKLASAAARSLYILITQAAPEVDKLHLGRTLFNEDPAEMAQLIYEKDALHGIL